MVARANEDTYTMARNLEARSNKDKMVTVEANRDTMTANPVVRPNQDKVVTAEANQDTMAANPVIQPNQDKVVAAEANQATMAPNLVARSDQDKVVAAEANKANRDTMAAANLVARSDQDKVVEDEENRDAMAVKNPVAPPNKDKVMAAEANQNTMTPNQVTQVNQDTDKVIPDPLIQTNQDVTMVKNRRRHRPTTKDIASDPRLSVLTCTDETFQKYQLKVPQSVSDPVVRLSMPRRTSHDTMCYFARENDNERIEILSHLLTRSFRSYTDQSRFAAVFQQIILEQNLNTKDIPKIMEKVPLVCAKAMECVEENDDDPVSHSAHISDDSLLCSVGICDPLKLVTSVDGSFLVECTLARVNHKEVSKPRGKSKKVSSIFEDPIVRTRTKTSLCSDDYDHLYRDLILIIPLAGVFFTFGREFQQFHSNQDDKSNVFVSVPLPFSWLRLRHSNGQPASGLFMRNITNCWFWTGMVAKDIISRSVISFWTSKMGLHYYHLINISQPNQNHQPL